MQLFMLLAEEMSYTQIIFEYSLYGFILLLGLIVLAIMRRQDKHSKIEICVKKTDELLEELEKMDLESLKEHHVFAKMNTLKSKMGDLVVLLEKIVVENRNVTYDGMLGLYKQALAQFENDQIVWTKSSAIAAIEMVKEKLQEGQKTLKELQ